MCRSHCLSLHQVNAVKILLIEILNFENIVVTIVTKQNKKII